MYTYIFKQWFKFYCNGDTGGSSDTTYTPDSGNVGPYDCNVGFWNDLYPLVDGECSWIENINDNTYSYKVECSSDGNSATLKTYENDDCSGTAEDTQSVDYFYCGATGDDCTVVDMGVEYYNSSVDCSGDWISRGALQLGQLDDCIDVDWAYLGISVTGDAVEIGYYDDSDCDGTASFSILFEEGCIEQDFSDNESWDVTLNEYDASDSGGSSSASVRIGNYNGVAKAFLGVVVLASFRRWVNFVLALIWFF